jgi:murein DD-endopeptidase MepM/ murein hydrolase activator NlpD
MELLRRQYTVMIVPDASGQLRRLHVRGAHVAWVLGLAAVLTVAAVCTPVLGLWSRGLARELAAVEQERDQLVERSAEVEATLGELRAKLDAFERRTRQLGYMAGLEMPALATGAQGHSADAASLSHAARAELHRTEAEDLAGIGALLDRRLDTLEQAFDEQSDRLSRVPSLLPVRGLIGAGFGWRRDPFTGLRQYHRGLDIAAPEGTPIQSPADGIVVKTETHRGYGMVLYVSHGDGIVSRYAHCSEFKVRPGQKVRRGDVIGLVGNTGRSTAPHLHYEVLLHGKQVNPMKYVSVEGLFY